MSNHPKWRMSVLWVAFACSLVFCSGITVWWISRNAMAKQKLERQLLTLRTNGMPVDDHTLSEFHARLTDGQSTAEWLEVIRAVESVEFRKEAIEFLLLDIEDEIPSTEESWDRQAEVSQLLTRYAAILELVNKVAIHNTPVRFPIQFDSINTSFDHAQSLRDVARCLVLEHELAIRENDELREYQAIQSLLGCAIAVRGEPSFPSYLISISIHSLAASRIQKSINSGKLNASHWDAISDRLDIFDDYTSWTANTIAGERAMTIPVFQNLTKLNDKDYKAGMAANPIDALNYLAIMENFEKTAKENDLDGFLAKAETLDAELKRQLRDTTPLFKSENMLTALFFPATYAVAAATVRSVMLNRLAKTGVAIRLFQLQSQKLPEGLSDLKSLPFDLNGNSAINGEPFGYMANDEGAILWGFDFSDKPVIQPDESVPLEPPSTDPNVDYNGFNRIWVWTFRN